MLQWAPATAFVTALVTPKVALFALGSTYPVYPLRHRDGARV